MMKKRQYLFGPSYTHPPTLLCGGKQLLPKKRKEQFKEAHSVKEILIISRREMKS